MAKLSQQFRLQPKRHQFWIGVLASICGIAAPTSAAAQVVNTYNVTDASPAAITDLSCNLATSSQIVRTFSVGGGFIVGDVDLGVLLNHTYRSDLRIFLTSPAGTTVTIMTWTGNVQSGDNLNDLFDDEATAAIGTHNATVIDPLTAPYSHSFQPSSPLSAFDGQNAAGTWTLRICDAVGSDVGNFRRADLYLTSTSLSVTKVSSVVSDPQNGTTLPKAIPGAVVQYCLLATNNGRSTAPNATAPQTNIVIQDPIPASMTYVPGSMLSGTTCAAATTPEDDNNTGTDESDPIGASITGTTITGTAASLAATATFAIVFQAVIN